MNIPLCPACAPRVITAAVRDHIDVLNPEHLAWYVKEHGRRAIEPERRALGGQIRDVAVPAESSAYCEFHQALAHSQGRQAVRGETPTPYTPPPPIGGFQTGEPTG